MNKQEILNEIKSRKLQVAEILDTIKNEKRELTNVEQFTVDSANTEVKDFEMRLKDLEKQEVIDSIKVGEERKDFSLMKSIRQLAENKGIEQNEILTRGANEFRKAGLGYNGQLILPSEFRSDILAGTSTQGQEIVAENKLNLMGALRANSVLGSAGSQMLGGLSGDISIPVYSGSSVAWKGETTAAADGAGAFTEVTLSPKRLTAYVDVSKLFLLQDSVGAESLLYNDLMSAVVAKLENTFLGTVSGSTTQPAGIFYDKEYAVSGTTSWSNVVTLESAVDTANALTGNLAYIIHPTTNGLFKTTAKASNQAIFIKDGNNVNGYKTLVTSNMPTIGAGKGVVFANWSDFVIGQWGGMDITVDPYTVAKEGKVRLVINTYWDGKFRRDESYAVGMLS